MKKYFSKVFLSVALFASTIFSVINAQGTPTNFLREFELINKLSESNENTIISPFSIKSAFMLAANGAKGETQREILDFFSISDIEKTNLHFKKITESYAQKEEIKISNSVWINKGLNFKSAFKEQYTEKIKNFYNATAGEVNSLNAIRNINNWCAENTQGKIKNIINSSDFLSVLINTVYFKSHWETPFKERNTKKSTFYNCDGTSCLIKFMNQTNWFNYFENDDFQSVELRYKKSDISMYIILPKNGKNITVSAIGDAVSKKQAANVKISLPKFKVESDLDLKSAIQELGIKNAFNQNSADFTDMFSNVSKKTFISKVIHKACIEVDESGSEAAAATAISITTTSFNPGPKFYKEFNVDHPFIYMVRDNKNDETLFLGKIQKF